MDTDVGSSLGALTAELENAKRSLHKIDDNIKKIAQNTGRFQNDRHFQNTIDSSRGGSRVLNSNFYQENRNIENERHARKRPKETKTVFSRLSARTAGDSDGDEEFSNKKPRVSSQVIRELPSKQQVLKAQAGDEVSKARSRRMFGSLLGTLQKFKQEEISLKVKEDKKARVEKKIEEQAKQERENERKERQNLFAEREFKKATIKTLEEKMVRMQQFEMWESVHKPLINFIQSKWKPHIYWLPKIMNHQAKEKQDISRKMHEKIIEDKQIKLKDELIAIEEKCRRGFKIPPSSRRKPGRKSRFSETQNESVDSIQDEEENYSDVSITKIKQERDESKKEESHNTEELLSTNAIKLENKSSDIKNGKASAAEKRHSQKREEALENNDESADPKTINDVAFENGSNSPQEDTRSPHDDAADANDDPTGPEETINDKPNSDVDEDKTPSDSQEPPNTLDEN